MVGIFQLIDSPVVAEIIGLAGPDLTILNQEFGQLTAETCIGMCAAAELMGAAPIVRVRENTAPEIQRALDIGAADVEIPQIETCTDVEKAVRSARFSPLGERGLSPYMRAGGQKGGERYNDRQNVKTTVIIHLEGQEGVENLDDIMEVEGIDVLFLGPYDLPQVLGIPG